MALLRYAPFRVSFRITITTLVVILLSATVSVIAVLTFINTRANVLDLTVSRFQVLSALINERVNRFLAPAYEQGRISSQMFSTGFLEVGDFGKIARYWLDVMPVYPNLAYLSVGREEDGEYLMIARGRDSRLSVRELRRDPQTGELGFREYLPKQYPGQPSLSLPSHSESDPRSRPWFEQAKKAGIPVWTDAYVFLGEKGQPDEPGFSYAIPLYCSGKRLEGVMTVDFALTSLCHFLKTLQGERDGLFFIVEVRQAQPDRIIAHPDPDTILRRQGSEGSHSDLIPEDEIEDPIGRALLAEMPDEMAPYNVGPRERVRLTVNGETYIGGYGRLKDPTGPNWVTCGVVNERNVLARVHRNNRILIGTATGGFLLALLVSLILAARISRPLQTLSREVGEVGQGVLTPVEDRHSLILEIDQLYQATEEMKTGLRSFEKYVPRQLVRGLLASGEEACIGGERRCLTVFFSDLEGFTAMAETLPPEVVVELLTEIHETLSSCVLAEGGTIDKFIGDALMAFWGAPKEVPDHSLRACRAALDCQERLGRLMARWKEEAKPVMRCRIGINTSEVIVGNMGAQTRLDYTVVGDGVNLASRLEGLNKYYGTTVLISEATYNVIPDQLLVRPIDRVSVKGKQEPVLVYELLSAKEPADTNLRDLAVVHSAALAAYFQRNWLVAETGFDQVLVLCPNDRPAQIFRDRCAAFHREPPPEDWEGIHRMDVK